MSNDLNLCQFLGRLGKDPDIRYTGDGKAIASFSLACGSSWKDKQGNKQESTEWVNCTAFGKLAEIVGEYVTKGSQLYVSGRIKTDKYEKDGKTLYSTKIVVDNMQMLGGKGEKSEPKVEQENTHRAQAKEPAKIDAKDPFGDMEDDITF